MKFKKARVVGIVLCWTGLLTAMCLSAAAQDAGGSLIDPSFPFLSLTTEGLRSLKTGFMIQWQLFNGYTKDGPSALYFAALAATLVGALAIVFNKGYHNAKTSMSWLLLVVICLFAPFHSKLLFYPVVNTSEIEATAAKDTPQCGSYAACGFTPQVVAAHVGTTLQVIVTDIFRNSGFNSLVDGVTGMVKLGSDPHLAASESWLADVLDYQKSCIGGDPLLPTILQPEKANSGTNQGNAAAPHQAYTMGTTIDRIKSTYANAANGGWKADFGKPPPAIVLTTNSTSVDYAAGIREICNKVAVGRYDVCSKPADGVSKSLENDIAKIEESIVGQAGGWWKQTTGLSRNEDRLTPGSLLFYLRPETPGTAQTAVDNARKKLATACTTTSTDCTIYQKEANALLTSGREANAGPQFNSQIANMSALLRSAAFRDAPAIVYEYGALTGANNVSGAESKSYCDNRAAQLFADAFQAQDRSYVTNLSGPQTRIDEDVANKLKSGLYALLTKQQAITAEDLENLKKTAGYGLASTARTNLNDKIAALEVVRTSNQNADWRVTNRAVAGAFLQSVMSSTAGNSEVMKSFQQAELSPRVTGALSGSDKISGFLAGVGKIMVVIDAAITGAKAATILLITQVFINMCLAIVLIVTPILFLLGIVIPSHAAGLLIQSFLFVFILKMVPVVFVIVDSIGLFVLKMMATGGTVDAEFRKSCVILAVCGMYSSIVGLTMFILFKLGDVQNVQKLTEIDKAAEKVADAGIKVAQFLGGIAGAGFGGGALAAIGKYMNSDRLEDAGDALKGRAAGKLGALGSLVSGNKAAEETMADRDRREKQEEDIKKQNRDLRNSHNLPPRDEDRSREELAAIAESEANKKNADFRHSMGAFRLGDEDHIGSDRAFDGQIKAGNIANASSIAEGMAREQFNARSGPLTADQDMKVGELQAKVQSGEITSAAEARAFLKGAPGAGMQQNPSQPQQAGPNKVWVDQQRQTQDQQRLAQQQRQTSQSSPGQQHQHRQQQQANAGNQQPNQQTPMDQQGDRVTTSLGNIADVLQKIEADLRANMLGDGAKTNRLAALAAHHAGASASLKEREAAESGATLSRDKDVGYLRTFASGAFGAVMASGQLSKIPGFGDAFREVGNEFYEGEQRARHWKNTGFKEWWKKKGQAARNEAMKKTGAHYAAGAEYEEMMNQGVAYTSMYRNARFAGAQAAAKNTDQAQAMKLVERDRDRLITAEDFRGATLANAIESLESALQAGTVMREGKITVADGSINLGPNVLKELVSSKSAKAVSGQLEDLFTNHMYLNEKDRRPGYSSLDRTKGDAQSIVRFVQEDLSDDYKWGAFMKGIEGKEKFFRLQGLAEAFSEAKTVEEDMIKQLQSMGYDSTTIKKHRPQMPLSAIHEMAMVQGYNANRMHVARASQVKEEKQDLDDQLRNLKRLGDYVRNFPVARAQLIQQFTTTASKVAPAQAMAPADWDSVFTDIDTSRQNRGMFGDVVKNYSQASTLRSLLMSKHNFKQDEAEEFLREMGYPI